MILIISTPKLLEVTFHGNRWSHQLTVKDHGVQIYTCRWQQNADSSYGGVPKVESVACHCNHEYLASCIICLCVIYASYTRMQVLTIKSVNQKLC